MNPRESRPLLPLTSVRFFAALYVVLLHSVAWSNHLDTSSWFGRFLRTGYTAVGFFFVLSGYILAHVYLDTDLAFDRRKFWISRFARTYPLLCTSLLLDVPNNFLAHLSLHSVSGAAVRTVVELTSELALLQAWDGHFRSINAPSWSLSAEAFFYTLFPFLAFWVWRWKGRCALAFFFLCWICALAAPLLVTWRYPPLFVEVDSSKMQWSIELMPIFRLFEFLGGIALCSFQKSLSANLGQRQMNNASYLLLCAGVILFIITIEFANRIPLLAMSNGFLLPVYGLVILGLTNVGGWLRNLLSHKWLVLLGEASYALYLLHSPIWLYFSRLHVIDTLSIWCVYMAAVTAASLASFLLLERPARRAVLSLASIKPRVRLEQEE